MLSDTSRMEQKAVAALRILCLDAVEAAGSGHLGAPLGLAPAFFELWFHHMSYDPADPFWPDRDRFVLSGGHAGILQYAWLALTETGADPLTLEDLRKFRQTGSRTPGHPEYGEAAGIEMTTGPLGQGCAGSVGMAAARKWLAARYNRQGFPLFTHRVTAFCGDGDLMEGVSSEAASLAARWQLDDLLWVYDSNGVSIEGPTSLAFAEDVAMRFRAYGWAVLEVSDGNDLSAIARAFDQARNTAGQPVLIILHTIIGFGSEKAGTSAVHAGAFSPQETARIKADWGWPESPSFYVPEALKNWIRREIADRNAEKSAAWRKMWSAYQHSHPAEAQEIDAILKGRLPLGWDAGLDSLVFDPARAVSTRISAGEALQEIAPRYPWLMGGAADLSPSTFTRLKAEADFGPPPGGHFDGRNIRFGVREHAMAGICNGLALSGVRPFCAGFLVFADYLYPALRLAAMMNLPVIYIFTLDSIGVGGDGPTHQPVEHLTQLRAIPNVRVLRPADATESRECWRLAVECLNGPAVLALSRQALPVLAETAERAKQGVACGGYVLRDFGQVENNPEAVLLMGSGSEVSLLLEAGTLLAEEGQAVRVVSMPCCEIFDSQPGFYRKEVLPPAMKRRLAVEAGCGLSWHRYVGLEGKIVSVENFGRSGDGKKIMELFGFDTKNILRQVRLLPGVQS